jgi:hypothetical protein
VCHSPTDTILTGRAPGKPAAGAGAGSDAGCFSPEDCRVVPPAATHRPFSQTESPRQSTSRVQGFGWTIGGSTHTPWTQIRSPLHSMSFVHCAKRWLALIINDSTTAIVFTRESFPIKLPCCSILKTGKRRAPDRLPKMAKSRRKKTNDLNYRQNTFR